MDPIRNNPNYAKRNDPCPCGSGSKWKRCCSDGAPRVMPPRQTYIDEGEVAIRWVITDETGTKFFADKDNRVIVFEHKDAAIEISQLEEFASQSDNEINVAGVGPKKFEHLKEILPYVEVSDLEIAAGLVRERIAIKKAELQTNEEEQKDADQDQEQEAGAESQEGGDSPGQEAADQSREAPEAQA